MWNVIFIPLNINTLIHSEFINFTANHVFVKAVRHLTNCIYPFVFLFQQQWIDNALTWHNLELWLIKIDLKPDWKI